MLTLIDPSPRKFGNNASNKPTRVVKLGGCSILWDNLDQVGLLKVVLDAFKAPLNEAGHLIPGCIYSASKVFRQCSSIAEDEYCPCRRLSDTPGH